MDCLSAENEQGGNGLSRETVDFLCSVILGFTTVCDEVAAKAAGNYLALRSILSLEDSHSCPPGGRVKPGDHFWPLQIAHIICFIYLHVFTFGFDRERLAGT